MRKKGRGALHIKIIGPDKGLVTQVPENLADKDALRAMTGVSNMRFGNGTMRNAPGHRQLPTSPVLTEVPNFLFQGNISSDFAAIETSSPIIGTSGKLYAITRHINIPPLVDAG
jgi:hypothetical protein